MITARIYNTDMEPLSEIVEVEDDAEFEVLEARAAAYAQTDGRCCIRWQRDSDGQVAYWGPNGAMFQPHWYDTSPFPKI